MLSVPRAGLAILALGCAATTVEDDLADDALPEMPADKADSEQDPPLGTYIAYEEAGKPSRYRWLLVRDDGTYHRELVDPARAEDGRFRMTRAGTTDYIQLYDGSGTRLIETAAYRAWPTGIGLRVKGTRTWDYLMTPEQAGDAPWCVSSDDCQMQGLEPGECPNPLGSGYRCAATAEGHGKCEWACAACDPRDGSGCGAGQKCALAGTGVLACVADGTLAEGASCDPASDRCQGGLGCAPGLDGAWACRTMCYYQGDCGFPTQGTCSVLVDPQLGLGACTPLRACSVTEQDCPADAVCTYTVQIPKRIEFCQQAARFTPAGGACGRALGYEDAPAWPECEAGTLCSSGYCRAICSPSDASMPCAQGEFCGRLRDGSGLGVCAPVQ